MPGAGEAELKSAQWQIEREVGEAKPARVVFMGEGASALAC